MNDIPLPDDIKEWIKNEKFQVLTEAAEVAGGIVAKNEFAAQLLLRQKVWEHKEFFNRVRHPHTPTQEGITWCRVSGQPVLTHLIRTTRSTFTQPACKEFDDMVCQTIEDKLGMRFPEGSSERHQVQLPVHSWGLGFRPTEPTAPMAFFASTARCISVLHERGLPVSVKCTEACERILENIQAKLNAQEPTTFTSLREQLPLPTETFVSFYTKNPSLALGLQSQLSVLQTMNDKKQVDAKSEVAQARLESLSQPNSSRWLLALPTDKNLKMDNKEFQIAVKIRLGKPVTPNVPTVCGLCQRHVLGQDLAAHLLGCIKLIPTSGTDRHDAIVQIIKEAIERIGGLVTVEPRNLSDRDKKRGDLRVVLGAETYLIDVTIRNNTASSHLCPDDNKRTLREAEAAKKRKYEDHCKPTTMIMVPFALDVYGSLGDEAIEFVDTLATYAKQNGTSDGERGVRDQLLDEISVTLQRHNARMISKAVHVFGHQESDPFRFEGQQLAMRLSSAMSPAPHNHQPQEISLIPAFQQPLQPDTPKRFISPTSSSSSTSAMSLGACPMDTSMTA